MSKKNRHAKKNQPAKKDKKDQVLGAQQKSHTATIAIIAVGVLIIATGVYMVTQSSTVTASPAGAPLAGAPLQASSTGAGELTHPVGLFDDGKAKHFEYKHPEGETIRYFVLKSSDGILRAAFDACDVCWPANKGYYQDGDVMVCRNCGRRFESVLVNEVQGGCNPAPLQRRIDGDRLVIDVKDILQGVQYFNFSGKA